MKWVRFGLLLCLLAMGTLQTASFLKFPHIACEENHWCLQVLMNHNSHQPLMGTVVLKNRSPTALALPFASNLSTATEEEGKSGSGHLGTPAKDQRPKVTKTARMCLAIACTLQQSTGQPSPVLYRVSFGGGAVARRKPQCTPGGGGGYLLPLGTAP